MPFIINCPGCKRKLRVKEHLVGKTIKCPACGLKLLAQAPETLPSAETPNGIPVVPAPAVPTPTPTHGAVGKVGQTSAPTVSSPPSPSSTGNEEPLEVLDPIVLEETSTPLPKNSVTETAPSLLPKESGQEKAPLARGEPHPQVAPLAVLALLMGLLLATITLGVVFGWWINRSIDIVRTSSPTGR